MSRHPRSRAYRWGEDGIAGLSDRNQYLCFAVALWNGKDPILKERMFGLNGKEGNHGEDVKEYYFYLNPRGFFAEKKDNIKKTCMPAVNLLYRKKCNQLGHA